ncbi:MATE family efflux transporter [Sporomusa ovata]|uniref:MATE family efflux transporter n=1 Tax=Sporomusa ovata TaxID=2378 RepID=UPI001C6FC919|nr:MATE family efflux transporter [Sporomusa ovata]
MGETCKDEHVVTYRHIVKISYPVVLSMLAMNIMVFVDRTFVAQYNLTQFAAMMPAGFFAIAVANIFTGIIGYVSVLVAQYYGAGRYRDCAASMWQGIYLSLFFVLALFMLSPFLANTFQIMGHAGDLLQYEGEYFRLIILAECVQLFSIAFFSFYRGIGDTRTTMYVGIVTNIVNIVLDWLLVFGKYGLPEMGMLGSGMATIISCTIGLILYVLLLSKKKFEYQYNISKIYNFNRSLLNKLLKFGLFAGVQSFVDTGYFSLLLIIIGATGEFNLTCANIAFAIEAISILPVIGITTAVGIIAGQERGANRLENIAVVTKKGIMVGLCFILVIITVCSFSPGFLISFFNSEQKQENVLLINNTTILLLRLTSIWLVFDTIHLTIGSVLQSLGDTKFMMVIYAVVPFLFYVILPYVFCVVAQFPLVWLWITLLGYSVIMTILVTNRFLNGKWKSINVI